MSIRKVEGNLVDVVRGTPGPNLQLHLVGAHPRFGAISMRKYVVVEIVDGARVLRSEPLSRHAAAIECARISEDGYLVRVEPVEGRADGESAGGARGGLRRLLRLCTASLN